MTYASVHEFFTAHRLVHKDTSKWRLTKPCYGQINGLPHFIGCLVATNGILCYLISSGGELIQGHLDWFVKNPTEDEPQLEDGTPLTRHKPKRSEILTEDLIKLISL